MEDVPVGKFGFIKRHTVDWFTEHRSVVATGAVCVLALLLGASRFMGWIGADAQVDFVAADLTYNNWKGGLDVLAKLEKLIRRHPELHAKYDGAIAQKLLSSSEKGLASSYASANLRRIEDFSPHYPQYTKGTLMIADGRLADALHAAKQLKADLEKDTPFWEKRSAVIAHGAVLYAYNLLRIAMLEGSAGSPEGELAAWNELKMNAGWLGTEPQAKTYDPEAYALIQKNFQRQNVSLLDFIEHREEALKSELAGR